MYDLMLPQITEATQLVQLQRCGIFVRVRFTHFWSDVRFALRLSTVMNTSRKIQCCSMGSYFISVRCL